MSGVETETVESSVPAHSSWRQHAGDVRPTVLILGGFLTAPPMYRPFAKRLLERGAAGVVVAHVWTPDWLVAAGRGCAAVTARSGRALLTASRLSANVSDGAPVLVVGHSAGGLIARLLTAAEPFPGRRFGAALRIGAIVTLGTPHSLAAGEGLGRRINEIVAGVAEATVPGAFYAPEVGYVSVASRAIRADPSGTGRQRLAHLLYRSVSGHAAGVETYGDGLVPVEATILAGADHVVLDGSVHGQGGGGPWYGTDPAMDVWWPAALRAWREALICRATQKPSDTPV